LPKNSNTKIQNKHINNGNQTNDANKTSWQNCVTANTSAAVRKTIFDPTLTNKLIANRISVHSDRWDVCYCAHGVNNYLYVTLYV